MEEVPDGGVAHLTWFDGGDCHNSDAWESEEAFNAYVATDLRTLVEAVGALDRTNYYVLRAAI